MSKVINEGAICSNCQAELEVRSRFINAPLIGSEHVAFDLNISRRNVNHIKNQEGFPPLMWVGRQWRVDREAYEAWKVLCYKKSKGE